MSLECDWIDNDVVFKAVSFALAMIRDDKEPAHAITTSAKHYGVDTSEVAHYVGQHAARIKNNRKKAGESDFVEFRNDNEDERKTHPSRIYIDQSIGEYVSYSSIENTGNGYIVSHIINIARVPK